MSNVPSSATSDRGPGLETSPPTGAHRAAIALAALTGPVHLYLFWTQAFVSFLLAGLGFIGALGLILVGSHRRPIYLPDSPRTARTATGQTTRVRESDGLFFSRSL